MRLWAMVVCSSWVLGCHHHSNDMPPDAPGDAGPDAGQIGPPSCHGAMGFPSPPPIDIGSTITGLATGAVDGTAGTDLVVETVDGFVVLGGAHLSQHVVTTAPNQGLALGDFDDDGHLDVALAAADDPAHPAARIWMQQSDGTFAAAAATGIEASTVSTADFNADGKSDLVIQDLTNNAGVYLGAGDGTFGQVVASSARAAQALAIGDLDGQHGPDLVYTQGSAFEVRLGAGDGTFAPPISGTLDISAGQLFLADLNHDGHLDLVAASTTITVELGVGNGTFGAPIDLAIADQPRAVIDFDGDGNPDLVGRYGVYRGVGDGTFEEQVGTPIPRDDIDTIADVTGDGAPDVIGASGQRVVVIPHGATAVVAHTVSTPSNANSLVLADFDRDGKLDYATGDGPGFHEFSYGVALGRGDGAFAEPAIVPEDAAAFSIVAADFNGDHVPDLAFDQYIGNGGGKILVGAGNGTFTASPASALGDALMIAVDLDRDGLVDLVGAAPEFGLVIARATGPLAFDQAASVSLPDVSPWTVAAGDLDGDGRLDLVVTARDPLGNPDGSFVVTLHPFLARADGTFAPMASITTGTASGNPQIAAGNLDGDGKADVVITDPIAGGGGTGPVPGTLVVYRGHGDGSFDAGHAYPTGEANVVQSGDIAVRVVDLDADGKLDVVTGNRDGTVGVHYGNGDGTLAPVQTFLAPGGGTGVQVADIDNDGRPDLVTLGSVLVGRCYQ